MIAITAINTSGFIGVNIEKKDNSKRVILVFIVNWCWFWYVFTQRYI